MKSTTAAAGRAAPPTLWTSVAAKVGNAAAAAAQRARVLEALRDAGGAGLTDDEMQDRLRMSGNTQRPRRGELEREGLVISTEMKRPTRSGRLAVVWMAV